MKRYTFIFGYGEVWREGKFREHPAPGHLVIDRRQGHGADQAIAFCQRRDDAERIVDALNTADGRK